MLPGTISCVVHVWVQQKAAYATLPLLFVRKRRMKGVLYVGQQTELTATTAELIESFGYTVHTKPADGQDPDTIAEAARSHAACVLRRESLVGSRGGDISPYVKALVDQGYEGVIVVQTERLDTQNELGNLAGRVTILAGVHDSRDLESALKGEYIGRNLITER